MQEHGRDELRLPHGPRPRADHAPGFDVAGLDDPERGNELLPAEGRASAFEGQCRQGFNDVETTKILSEIALKAPDRRDDAGRHAVLVFGASEALAELAHVRAPLFDPVGRNGAVHVIPDGTAELGLVFVQFENPRAQFHIGEGPVERRGCDTLGKGVISEACDPFLEFRAAIDGIVINGRRHADRGIGACGI